MPDSRSGLPARAIGADHVHANFRGGVPSEDGAILDKHDGCASPGGRQRGADSSHSAAGDTEVRCECCMVGHGKKGEQGVKG